MIALISPNEKALSYDGVALGLRIAEVRETEFPVAPPLFWTACPVDCNPDSWYYLDGQCLMKPKQPEPQPEE